MTHTHAWGHGLATITDDAQETVLDTWFPSPQLGELPAKAAVPAELAAGLPAQEGHDPRRGVRLVAVTVTANLTEPAASTSDAYLRLHLLSHLLVKPNTLNVDGIFGQLPNVAWTSAGPMTPDAFATRRPQLQREGITVHSLDKFPRLLDYVVPAGVRIADANRVRLGAYLSPGTTVMHEGFVNFNAGTLGASMVEGRISQGVLVGDGSDIGGGASVMGTLSGGGTVRVSIGERALLGANSGIGISLGDDCVVEAGLYVTAGTKVALPGEPRDHDGALATTKAGSLSGMAGLLFRRNSLTGAVEALPRAGKGVELNAALHA